MIQTDAKRCKALIIKAGMRCEGFFAVFGGIEGSWKGLIPFKLWVEALMNPQKQQNVATCCRCVASRKPQ
jgi:hypothetical protein